MDSKDATDRRSYYVFPYLRMTRAVKVGPFKVMPLDPVKLAAAKRGEDGFTIRTLLSRLRDPEGMPLTTGCIVTRHVPELPAGQERDFERAALQSAIGFAIADSNATESNEIHWDRVPNSVATAEVGAFYVLEIEALEEGRFFRHRGGNLNRKVWMGGSIYDDKTVISPAPEGLVDIPNLELDKELAEAVYAVTFEALCDETKVAHGAVYSALHWHARAWENSPLHTIPDALVQLKTAIEALSATDNTTAGITALETKYSAIQGTLGASDYLWDSALPRYVNVYKGRETNVSSFAHWYRNFANVRNSIVHSTSSPEMQYQEPGSPFNGNIFHVGERVTRELIKISLGQLGHPRAALSSRMRRFLDTSRAERTVQINPTLIDQSRH